MATNAKIYEQRPWGMFWILRENRDGNSVEKRIQVLPSQRLSLQSHKLRSEDWYIESGHGTVTLDDQEIKVYAADRIHIPKGAKHRIRNDSDELALVFHESTKGIFDEHDIERYEDDYDRDSSWTNQ